MILDRVKTSQYLRELQRFDLAILLDECECSIVEIAEDNGFFVEQVEKVLVRAPNPVDQALAKLPAHDRKRIAEALFNSPEALEKHFVVELATDRNVSSSAALLAELYLQRETMISVATGLAQIQDVNDYYVARQSRLIKMVGDTQILKNPHGDLWDWYKHWKSNFPTYAERRQYIKVLFGPAIEFAIKLKANRSVERDPTGWEKVDRVLAKARSSLVVATSEEDFQSIGLLCREVIISLGQAVFDPQTHKTIDGVMPSPTDANRMLEAFIATSMPGGSEKEVRSHARASLGLALHLQHRRTASRQLAELCLEATSSTVAVIRAFTEPIESIVASQIS